ncbi:hypothetical protein JMA_41500 (plasmid) [Jeotgalibacillus malaysiensis]|uniref:Uncharacterized protein n=1 Tax=Jeotgalibacillus malaysiensis TaxID=1508404 RepID=A0A0B5AXN9_9BACL|nr:hypothetical protein JMA_41500 [Jeotgalibacillus malaysiensis]
MIFHQKSIKKNIKKTPKFDIFFTISLLLHKICRNDISVRSFRARIGVFAFQYGDLEHITQKNEY